MFHVKHFRVSFEGEILGDYVDDDYKRQMEYPEMDVTDRDVLSVQPVDSVDNSEVSVVAANCDANPTSVYLMMAEAAAMAITDKNEVALLEETIKDLEYSLQQLEIQIDETMREFTAKRRRLDTWKQRLNELKGPEEKSAAINGKRVRNPKGANLRAIVTCLESSILGRSASEVQRETSLPWSSVQTTLKKHPDVFVEQNGLWTLKTEARAAARTVSNGIAKD